MHAVRLTCVSVSMLRCSFLDLKKYILERKDALADVGGKEESNNVEKIKPKGFGGKN